MAPEGDDLVSQVSETVATLRMMAAELDSLDDHLSTLIPLAEETLGSLHLNVDLWVNLATNEETGSYQSLGFRKWSGEWRLVVVEGQEGSDDEGYTLLTDTSRDDRVAGLAALPELLKVAVSQMQEKLYERRQMIMNTQVLLNAVAAASKNEVKP